MTIHRDDFDGNLRCGGRTFHQATKRTSIIVEKKYPHAAYFDFDGGVPRPKAEYFQSQDACPLCGSDDIGVLLVKDGMPVFQCGACTFGFQNPRFRAERLGELYSEDYSLNPAYSSELQKELDRLKFGYGLQQVRKHLPQVDSVLDIGAGNLLCLQTYLEAGVRHAYGMEPGSTLKDHIPGITLFTRFFESVPEELENLSLITMWDTLEHMHDFKRILTSAWRALADGGILLVMVPNLMSLASRLIREHSPSFCIYHLNYFTPGSLARVMSDAGFEVVGRETIISEIDNCRNYLEFQEPYMSAPRGEAAFAWLNPDYIHDNMLGSRLLFLGRKVG